MKISKILSLGSPQISFEVFPPKRPDPAAFDDGTAASEMKKTKEVVSSLAKYAPSFISVTYGAAGGTTGANTCEIAKHVESCGVTALAHLTCINSTREKVALEVESFKKNKIENVLCLRGDLPRDRSKDDLRMTDFSHAIDLVRELKSHGLCLGGACYPECHPECVHLRDDIKYLKDKVDAGLDFLATQMVFDNSILYSYLAKIRSAGINVPVIAGVMPVINGKQISRICSLTGTMLPPRFRAIVDRFGDSPPQMAAAGIAYATEQIVDLFANGVENVHVYTMNKPEIAGSIMENLGAIIKG